MQTHKTRGIVLRTVEYGDTSVIASVFTELFGLQSYIIKGIRQVKKRSASKAGLLQPSAILNMVVYRNELKNLQFVKEFDWAYMYKRVLFDVTRNAIAMYMMELLYKCLKQPEEGGDIYHFTEDCLFNLDVASDRMIANLPLFFTLQLGAVLGFRLQGEYNADTSILDLHEGIFTAKLPAHNYYLSEELAQITATVAESDSLSNLENLSLNGQTRRVLLEAYHQFLKLHLTGIGELKSLKVLAEVL